MRTGLTTGTCAAAAAKAAALLLAASGRDEAPAPSSTVDVTLPCGDVVSVAIVSARLLDARSALAAVVKDAGDDPDITNGMTVEATVELGGEGVRFVAGRGVGTVTRAGLQLAPGEPAINPVPRAMIERVLAEVLGEDPGATVTIGVAGGESVADKTFNPRLGIEGGISIIGTTGRVEPKSSEAWVRSLLPQVDVAVAAGYTTLWLTPGGIGEEFSVRVLSAPVDAVVQCANHVGTLLDACGRAGLERIVLVGHAGKLVKVAAGLFDTHSRDGDARLETVAAHAAALGASGPLAERLLGLSTVQAAITELEVAGLGHVWDAIAERAATRATARAGVQVEAVLLGYGGEALGASRGAELPDAAVGGGRPGDVDGPIGRPLTVVGTGPGAEEFVTPAAWREIRRAEVAVGGVRMLEMFAPATAERIVIGTDVTRPLTAAFEAASAGRRVVILASGDPSFFGVLEAVLRIVPRTDVRVVAGVSSAQLTLARLGESWDGLAVASAHGRDPENALGTCLAHSRTLVLVDRATPPQSFAAALGKRGMFDITVLEKLGYPEERVTTGSAAEIAAGEFDPLSVLFVRHT